MLRRMNKKLALVLVLTMLATMFIGVGTASAATTYSALSVPTVQDNTADVTLGTVMITEVTAGSIATGDILTVDLPSNVTFVNGNSPTVATFGAVGAEALGVVVPVTVGGDTNILAPADVTVVINAALKTATLTIGAGFPDPTDKGYIYLVFNHIKVGAVNGNINVTMSSPGGTGFTNGEVVIGKTSGGATTTIAKSVKTISNNGTDNLDDIIITESVIGTFAVSTGLPGNANAIKIALPSGFTWADGAISYQWGLTGQPLVGDMAIANVANDANGRSCVYIPIPAGVPTTTAGRIVISGASLAVDESVARLGEITAKISGAGNNNNVTTESLVIGKYAEYGVTVEGKTVEENIVAGKKTQDIGQFYVKENLTGSLINGRTITIRLPDGAKWDGYNNVAGTIAVNPLTIVNESGSTALTYAGAVGTDGTTIKYTVATGTKSTILFKNGAVDLAPNFSGDLTLTFAGTAGAAGEVVVAKAILPVTLEALDTKEVKIGIQKQAISDFTITEAKDEVIKALVGNNNIVLRLPLGSEWAAIPTVSVTAGDLVINTAAITKVGRDLTIPIKAASFEAGTIQVSGAYATLDRTVPEGPFKVALLAASTAIVDATPLPAITTLFPQVTAVTAVAVADVVTPAPGEQNAEAVFTINSADYTVNGAAQETMDVAPFIKDSRTYMPIRYVAYVLGIDNNNIIWDGVNNTVTLMKGDKVVQLKVGSTTLWVNGAAITMDVAPVNVAPGRVCLPIRFVAQAFGAQVDWDAATQQVTVTN